MTPLDMVREYILKHVFRLMNKHQAYTVHRVCCVWSPAESEHAATIQQFLKSTQSNASQAANRLAQRRENVNTHPRVLQKM